MRAAWHQPYDAIAGSPLPYQGRDLRDFGSTAIERYGLYILTAVASLISAMSSDAARNAWILEGFLSPAPPCPRPPVFF